MTIRILCQGTGSNCLAGIIGPNRESSPVPLQFSFAFDVRVGPERNEARRSFSGDCTIGFPAAAG
jgi:hypothetical protein